MGEPMACIRGAVGFVAFVCVLSVVGVNLSTAGQSGIPQPVQELLSIGEPGPKKIGLQVWGDPESANDLREGDRLSFTLQAEDDGYITIVALMADGTATILFPNAKQPDNSIKGDAVSTVFGDDSPVQLELGTRGSGSWIVFYVTSEKMAVDWSRMGEGGQWVKISPTAAEERRGDLRQVLAGLAKSERFNRLVLPIETAPGQGFELKPMESAPTSGKKPLKRMPGSVDTKRPGTTTGTQGIREQATQD